MQFRLIPLFSKSPIGYNMFFGFAPWSANPDFFVPVPPDQTIQMFYYFDHLPTVTEPTKLYYQVAFHESARLPNGSSQPSFRYYPDLSAGEEIPYIWVYPDPSWTD